MSQRVRHRAVKAASVTSVPHSERLAPARVHHQAPAAGLLQFQQLLGNRVLGELLRSAAPEEAPPQSACSCGGSCPECSEELEAKARRPTESPPDVEDFDDEGLMPAEALSPCLSFAWSSGLLDRAKRGPLEAFGPGPHEDSATIVCNGSDGYRVKLEGTWVNKEPYIKCGIRDCVRAHEESHKADWEKRFPDGCKGKKDGDPVPTGGPGYADFLRQSECRSYTGEVPCGESLLASASAECKPTVENQLNVWKKRKKSYCEGGC